MMADLTFGLHLDIEYLFKLGIAIKNNDRDVLNLINRNHEYLRKISIVRYERSRDDGKIRRDVDIKTHLINEGYRKRRCVKASDKKGNKF